MSKFLNIQEWVARRVISHIKYRDEEVEKLKRIIKEIDPACPNKCETCGEYEETVNMKSCNWCWMKVCGFCAEEVLFSRGINDLCSECTSYCDFCYPHFSNKDFESSIPTPYEYDHILTLTREN